MMNNWKSDNIKSDGRAYFRKITDAAENRMRTRTAKEQHADALKFLNGPDEIPDSDDASFQKRFE